MKHSGRPQITGDGFQALNLGLADALLQRSGFYKCRSKARNH